MTTPAVNVRICAVIVTYYPDLAVLGRLLRGIIPQVRDVVIVENTPDSWLSGWLLNAELPGTVTLIACGKNLGIAAAHNRGIDWARNHGCGHVLLMDQDSIPAADMVEQLVGAVKLLADENVKLAAVGPRYVDPLTRHDSFFVRFGPGVLKRIWCRQNKDFRISVDFLISSGSLISLETLSVVGPMDESLFIDHVDTEWFMRATVKGYRAFGVCDAVMEHSLGDETARVWLGRWRHMPMHSPLRHYYIIRNSVLLYRRDYVPVKWIFADVVRSMGIFFYYSLFTQPRLAHFSLMLTGLWHGLIGKTGPYPCVHR